jgi:hypoxanthine-DNA glycosylase
MMFAALAGRGRVVKLAPVCGGHPARAATEQGREADDEEESGSKAHDEPFIMMKALPEPSQGVPPIVDAGVRLLVLGSLPGIQSLRAAQYYAHPRNGFWPLMAGVIGAPLVSLPYADRLAALLEHGVGLWDVVAEARRTGSLDAAMRDIVANPLEELIRRLPRLQAIGFNGATAARIGRRTLGPTGLTLIDLPSSSAAFTLSLAQKAERWSALTHFVDSPPPQRPPFPA